MNRTKISASLAPMMYFMFIIAAFCLYILVLYIKDLETVAICLVVGGVSCAMAYLIYFSSTVEFDDENMYVSNKKFEETVPLKCVTAIKLTSMSANNRHFWKIVYDDDLNDGKTVKILPRYQYFGTFKEKVKEKNPNVEIKDYVFF